MSAFINSDRLRELRTAFKRLAVLEEMERRTGHATDEQIELENSFGAWADILEAIANAEAEA